MSLYKHKYKTTSGEKLSDHWYYRFNRDGETYTGSTGTSNKTQAAKFEDKRKQEINEKKTKQANKVLSLEHALTKYSDAMRHSGQHKKHRGPVSEIRGQVG